MHQRIYEDHADSTWYDPKSPEGHGRQWLPAASRCRYKYRNRPGLAWACAYVGLYSSLPIVVHDLLQTMVSMSNASYGADSRYFPRPDEFLPERWLPGNDSIKIKHPFAFLPFGFGPRMCVGRRFADLEIETIVAKVTYLSSPLSIRTRGGRSFLGNTFFLCFRFFETLNSGGIDPQSKLTLLFFLVLRVRLHLLFKTDYCDDSSVASHYGTIITG